MKRQCASHSGADECKADYALYVKLFMPDTIQVTSFIFIYIQY